MRQSLIFCVLKENDDLKDKEKVDGWSKLEAEGDILSIYSFGTNNAAIVNVYY